MNTWKNALKNVAIVLCLLVGAYAMIWMGLRAATAPGQLIVDPTQVQQID